MGEEEDEDQIGGADDLSLSEAYKEAKVLSALRNNDPIPDDEWMAFWLGHYGKDVIAAAKADAAADLGPGEVDDRPVPESGGWSIVSDPPDEAARAYERKRRRWDAAPVWAEFKLADEMAAKLIAQDLVREEYEERKLAGQPQPDIATLAEVLARPAPPADRIEGVLPADGSATLIAQNKAGKTTMVGNLVWSLIVGEPFLGKFPVQPIAPDARVAILNYEVSAAQLARWCADIGIPEDRLVLVNLRGKVNPLASDRAAQRLAAKLRGFNVEFVIVDPFGRAIGGADQNSAKDVQPWLNRLDRFAREMVGAKELVLVVHAGWNGERSRGSSALEDWPDAKWLLTKDKDTGLRYFRAEGRDVDVPEDRLHFDPETRHLTLTGSGSRSSASKSDSLAGLAALVLQYLAANPGASGKAVETEVPGNATDIRKTLQMLVFSEDVTKTTRVGKGGGYAYFAASATVSKAASA